MEGQIFLFSHILFCRGFHIIESQNDIFNLISGLRFEITKYLKRLQNIFDLQFN